MFKQKESSSFKKNHKNSNITKSKVQQVKQQLQSVSNNNPQAKKTAQLQNIINNNPQAKKTAQLQNIINNDSQKIIQFFMNKKQVENSLSNHMIQEGIITLGNEINVKKATRRGTGKDLLTGSSIGIKAGQKGYSEKALYSYLHEDKGINEGEGPMIQVKVEEGHEDEPSFHKYQAIEGHHRIIVSEKESLLLENISITFNRNGGDQNERREWGNLEVTPVTLENEKNEKNEILMAKQNERKEIINSYGLDRKDASRYFWLVGKDDDLVIKDITFQKQLAKIKINPQLSAINGKWSIADNIDNPLTHYSEKIDQLSDLFENKQVKKENLKEEVTDDHSIEDAIERLNALEAKPTLKSKIGSMIGGALWNTYSFFGQTLGESQYLNDSD